MAEIEVAAQMTKAQITPTHEEFFGKVNAAAVCIGGTVWGVASLMFDGFHGAILTPLDADKYVGVYRFVPVRGDDIATKVTPRIDFNRLPGWNSYQASATCTTATHAAVTPAIEPDGDGDEKGDE